MLDRTRDLWARYRLQAGWHQWAGLFARYRGRHELLHRVITAFESKAFGAVFRTWRSVAKALQTAQDKIRTAAARFLRLDLTKALRLWRRARKNGIEEDAVLRRACERLRQVGLVRALGRWRYEVRPEKQPLDFTWSERKLSY